MGTLPQPAATPPPSHQPAQPAAEARSPEGTWYITFHHPAGAQQLTLTIASTDGAISGSVTNPALGTTAPITHGTINGDHIACTTVLTKPLQATIDWDGTVNGDDITGQATVSGAPPFPFDGTRG